MAIDGDNMKKTALYDAHVKSGARIVEFAGYAMPVQYEGIIAEHSWTRGNVGVFDVSHMGQAIISGEGAAAFTSRITPLSFEGTAPYTAKYTVLTNNNGGIVDDLIITKLDEQSFFVVYNAGCREKDEAWIRSNLTGNVKFNPLDRSLIAVQGPKAEEVLKSIFDDIPEKYMTLAEDADCFISRLGYTGEDGFEISVANDKAEELWNRILSNPAAKPVGLGARDSLRLEMGYPLYGHDINDETSPVSASLSWVIAKTNSGFIGAEKILGSTPAQKRVGIEILDKGIVREGVEIFNAEGQKIGRVTSGGFSPTLQKPIAQGYVATEFTPRDTVIQLELRGRKIPGKIVPLNFIKPKTKSAK